VSAPQDERRHPPGEAQAWCEWWHLDFARDDGFGGFVRLTLYPNEQRAWFWAYIVTPDAPGPIVVRDHEVALPRGDALEVRADGLWSECTCEVPLEHWTYGLEAFGVRLDHPLDALHGEIGDRMPVGFDLEWEVLSPPFDGFDFDDQVSHYDHYEQAGTVHGEVLLGRERIELDGLGVRSHGWGDEPWYPGWGYVAFQTRERAAATGPRGGYVWRGGDHVDGVRHAEPSGTFQRDDGPDGLHVRIDDLSATAAFLRLVAIPLVGAHGGVERLDRALCRFTVEGDAVPAFGWAEWVP